MTQQYILDHQYLIIVMTFIVAGLIHTITALRSSFFGSIYYHFGSDYTGSK
ncbi:MAG: hypothetical protein MRJ93_05920 [Nitrososphaeraceae archaeon]|nr:hypothetical protein [Nitrososphaeraceae archaeon]